ncbi:hypothetical protein RJ639_008353 [Escallonia herrerae]|uniref:Inactive poly [ADP-ribose] polymerase SRO5 n=1 Tax=Escallonia herrerae TaxID=1293975 RepID=A0AA89ASJ9_9ASTE|nr:hypothetical protein RJ639_008353 [Escallonia herrerae]
MEAGDGCSEAFKGLASNNERIRMLGGEFKTDHDGQDQASSESESVDSGPNNEEFQSLGLIKLDDGDRMNAIIKRKFVSGLGSLGVHSKVEAIHRISYSIGFTKLARLQSFIFHVKAMAKKYGGNANVKYAWFGGSKDEICKVVSHGFGHSGKPENYGPHGCSVHLSPHDSPAGIVEASTPDEDSLRHVLLCRVLLGRTELVRPGTNQYHPSSKEFDSGVDQKYIVWSTNINTHILPEYVVSFRTPSCPKGRRERIQAPLKLTSQWMPFPTLISALSKFLPAHSIALIAKHHRDKKDKKISRHELIQRIREIAGEKLLISVVKSFRRKQLERINRSNSYNKKIAQPSGCS